MEHALATTADGRHVGQLTIDSLPDLVLLEIFAFYVGRSPKDSLEGIEVWIALAHVCQKWGAIVFRSPRCLNLQLLWTDTKREWEMEDIWPPLPIVVYGFDYITSNADTIVAALEHNDRVHQIKLDHCPSFLFQQVSPVIQKPFPALTDLALEFNSGMVPIVPDSFKFLGGSAPGLRSFSLKGIPFPFPALRKLLLSAADLIEVRLWRIPYYEVYISPWEIATCLSALTRLEEFHLGFGFDRRLLDDNSRLPPPQTR